MLQKFIITPDRSAGMVYPCTRPDELEGEGWRGGLPMQWNGAPVKEKRTAQTCSVLSPFFSSSSLSPHPLHLCEHLNAFIAHPSTGTCRR